MPAYVALLRAVNVRPRWVPMARVRELLPEHGFRDVQTYIQSGNVRVRSTLRSTTSVAERVRTVLSDEFGFDIPAVVRRPEALTALVRQVDALPTPLPGARAYVAFLDRAPTPAHRDVLDGWDEPGERARVLDDHVVLWFASGVHEARLTNARIERGGVVSTSRNLDVVRALADRWGQDN